ncbi:MAG TPA: hypothetical protein PKC97_00150 [Burkholderiaceae bacterium]|jgi:hypothetical protein|nr:hypothetical protein [Burkholderiaceae bacterium]
MIDPARYDHARDRIAVAGFTPAIQTKIALLLCAAKNGNLMFHAALQWAPKLGVVQQFLLSQSARELEAVAVLNVATTWARDPALMLEGSRIAAPLALAWSQVMLPPGPMLNPQAAYRGISLGHAQLARIRLLAVIPDEADALDPFVVALRRIEQESARMLQTQIRLLKTIGTEIAIDEREARVQQDQELVDRVFDAFLLWLAAP